MSLVHDLLEEAAKASSGTQRFVFILGSTARLAQITINGDSDAVSAIKTTAASYTKMQPSSALPGRWGEYLGDGISETIANRMAYAEACKLSVFPVGTQLLKEDSGDVLSPPDAIAERIGAIDLLQLARTAGGIFNYLTDEIIRRVSGINLDMEAQVVEKLGEDLPPTIGG